MKRLNSKGFGLVETMLVLAVVVIIGGIGYYVFSKKPEPKQQPAPTVQYKQETDSTQSFGYSYPENWMIEPYVWEDCCGGPPDTEPDWSKESKPITLHPSDNSEVDVTITSNKYDEYTYSSYESLTASVKEDYFAKILFDGTRDDGHKALFTKVDYLGPPDAKVESFTDHRYYFDNGDTYLVVQFREKYHHDWPDDEAGGPDIDNSKYLADFEHIAKSIKFSN